MSISRAPTHDDRADKSRRIDPMVAVAESCTGGMLMTRIVATPGSGDWFKGGIVAYDSEIKFRLLEVPLGPVISREAAIAMAEGARKLFDAEIGVAITGVAGPEPEEGNPVGTVYLGIASARVVEAHLLDLSGDPDAVRRAATVRSYQRMTQERDAVAADASPRQR